MKIGGYSIQELWLSLTTMYVDPRMLPWLGLLVGVGIGIAIGMLSLRVLRSTGDGPSFAAVRIVAGSAIALMLFSHVLEDIASALAGEFHTSFRAWLAVPMLILGAATGTCGYRYYRKMREYLSARSG